MPASLVQSKSTKGVGVSSVGVTITVNAGDALLTGGTGWGRAWAAGNMTDDRGQSHTIREHPDGTNVHCANYDSFNAAGGATTITGTPSGAANDTDITVHQVTGLSAGGFDKSTSQVNNTGSGTYDTGTTPTTTQADEYLFALFVSAGTSGTPTINNSFTIRQDIITTANIPLISADRVVSATGAYSAQVTANIFEWAALIATYQAAYTAPSATGRAPASWFGPVLIPRAWLSPLMDTDAWFNPLMADLPPAPTGFPHTVAV